MKAITAIVLAGGKSLRMGQDKGFVVLNGKTLLEHILEKLAVVFPNIILISSQKEYERYSYPVFADIIPDKGPLGGIYTGLRHSQTELNFVISIDMPFVSIAAIEYLIAKADAGRVHAAKSSGNFQPLFAIYPKSFCETIAQYLDTNHLKLISYVQENPHTWWDMSAFEQDENLLFLNINTPSQLEYATKMTQSIHIQAFGSLTDIVGKEPIALQGIGNTAEMTEKLEALYPTLKHQTYKIAVNQQVITKNIDLQEGDKIALLPPFSGG